MKRSRAQLGGVNAAGSHYDWVARVPIACAIATRTGRLVQANSSFFALMGLCQAEPLEACIADPDELAEYTQCVARLLSRKLERASMTVRRPRRRGIDVTIRIDLALESDRNDRHENLIAIAQEISSAGCAENALYACEDPFRAVFDGAPDAMFITNQNRCLEANAAACALFGTSRQELLGRAVAEFGGSHFYARATSSSEPEIQAACGNFHIPRIDGSVREVEFRVAQLPMPGLRVWVLYDVTASKAVEAELINKSELLQKIFDNIPVMISFSDVGGRIRWANREWERILGWTLSDVGDMDIVAHAYPDPAYCEDVRKFLRGEASRAIHDSRPLCKDGRVLDTSWRSVKLSDGSVVTIGQDVTARNRADRERERRTAQLHKARSRLQALSTRLVQLQEDERQSLARELHDEMGQLLTGLRLMIEREAATESRAEMMRVVQELMQRVRDLSMRLRPPMLDELGLVPTLLWQIERFEWQTGLQVEFRHANLDRRFTTETELTAFRIIQEGLTNVARHARVSHAKVRVWSDQRSLWAHLQDEGQGFNVKAALAAQSSGLSGMTERARLLGGRLVIESSPGGGARIMAELPAKQRVGNGSAA